MTEALSPDGLLEGLNGPQAEAVAARGQALLVIAGAGSGKTRVLTRRVAHLVATGDAKPERILAVTFTRRAAGEMRSRVEELVGRSMGGAWVLTFHAACLRILRSHAERIGYRPRFAVLDTDDADAVIRRCARDDPSAPAGTPAKFRSWISREKTAGRSPEACLATARGPWEAQLARLYGAYEEALRRAGAMDFDDLLVRCVRLLREDEAVASHWRGRFSFVLVDEYQDTNAAQDDIVGALCEGRPGALTVVGDSDQGIYGFRGAAVANILGFEKRWPGCRTVKLEENYRSTPEILAAANSLIANNAARPDKSLWTGAPPGEEVLVVACRDDEAEARFVAERVARLRRSPGAPGVAVLYRAHALSRLVERELVALRVPYSVRSGLPFWQRREVKDVLAWLRLVADPLDWAALRRASDAPRRGLGAGSLSRLQAHAEEHGADVLRALRSARDAGLSGKPAAAAAWTAEAIARVARAESDGSSPAQLVSEVVRATGYDSFLAETAREEGEAAMRLENVGQLASAAAECSDLAEFLDSAAVSADGMGGGEEEAVVLSTVHGAKGLEFDAVFVVGAEEGLLPWGPPDPDDIDGAEAAEEERRLMYVAATRARRSLVVAHASFRTMWGEGKRREPSRFVAELGPGARHVEADA